MIKSVLVTFTIFISGWVYSQDDFVPETYFGIKGGLNTSGIVADPIIGLDIHPGFTSGIVFKHISQKSLGIQIELNYNQAGWSELLDSTNTYKRRLNYIELPILSHVSIGNKNTHILINLGPYVSYLLSESEDVNLLEGYEREEYYGAPIKNNIGFGLCFGLGVSQNTSAGLFQIEGRVTYALSNVFETGSELNLSSSKNIVAEVNLSYLLDYKKVKNLIATILHSDDSK